MKGPKVQGVNSLLVKDIGSAIRSLVGMKARTFHNLEQSEQWKVWNVLSPWYMWDNNDIVTVRWIMDTAQARYKEWKCQCHNVYQEHGPEGMPTESFMGGRMNGPFSAHILRATRSRNSRTRTRRTVVRRRCTTIAGLLLLSTSWRI
uniref:uncharacterized protein LOC105350670 n=1 Tax=Fragaria vesca subsp. vesca TaxID=101020 RepID=UPI0005C8A98F|nr:PREDICTED: uncharacterized protein LOC105350670 [Fragaria vesca subsp. vesca]